MRTEQRRKPSHRGGVQHRSVSRFASERRRRAGEVLGPRVHLVKHHRRRRWKQQQRQREHFSPAAAVRVLAAGVTGELQRCVCARLQRAPFCSPVRAAELPRHSELHRLGTGAQPHGGASHAGDELPRREFTGERREAERRAGIHRAASAESGHHTSCSRSSPGGLLSSTAWIQS